MANGKWGYTEKAQRNTEKELKIKNEEFCTSLLASFVIPSSPVSPSWRLGGFVWFRLPNADDLGADGVKFAHIFFLQFADLRNSTILFVSTSVRLARSFMCMPMVSHCALL